MKRYRTVYLAVLLCVAALPVVAQVHTIEIVADKDSRYRVNGQVNPTITLKAGEPVHLVIRAVRAKTMNRDGSIHGFAMLRAKDRSKVDGWVLLLKPGTQEFDLTAPEVGDYQIVCTVICSEQHEQMHMKVIVTS